jgi:adenine-specific DNA-methyltransferase
VNRIIWAKQHGLHARNKFSCRHEALLWFSKTKEYKFYLDNIRVPQKYQNKKHFRGDKKGQLSCNPDGKNPGDIWVFGNVKHNHEEQTIHPCQFPEDMITRIVLSTTDLGDLVLDPYMGTATTAVVAKDLGRLYTGAELDEGYFEVSQRRLSGLPNEQGEFANLKCLRQYITKTGADPSRYSFDKQTTKTPSMTSKIFSEEYHLEELYERLAYENDCFTSKLNNLPLPENHKYDKLKPRENRNNPPSS